MFFYLMFLMFFSSVKETNWLISKRILNIYLNVTIEKNYRSQITNDFGFPSLKNLSTGQFLESSNSRRLNFQIFCCNLNIRVLEQNCVWLFNYFNSERNYDVFKSKSPCIVLNKNMHFNKNETKSKRDEPCVSAHTRIAN